ncbi:DUF4363 family protein [Microseira wollei]|uniref:DUF4363 domain-containing protein n=1 Tax=Microseira wollei NIES-4236 TaxID=2530354 RepID=A0AAV3XHU4_9CYAN|nr:DUF4363 family protein [Microseira wollei]GET40064.1 hypothetical protein MiSe_48720 [Microseira wollei NIES-4236]
MINRLSYAIAITTIGLLALTGCSSNTQPTSQASPAVETTAPTAATTASNTTQEGFTALVGVVSNTKTAVEAGNFDQAQKAFDKFEDAWNKVEDGVKAKSAKSYEAIEDAESQVESAIKAKDKAKALAGLQALDKNIATVSKR